MLLQLNLAYLTDRCIFPLGWKFLGRFFLLPLVFDEWGQEFAFLKNFLMLLPPFWDHTLRTSDPVLPVLGGYGSFEKFPAWRGGRGQGKFHRGSDVLKNKEKVVRICQALLLLLLLSRFSRV